MTAPSTTNYQLLEDTFCSRYPDYQRTRHLDALRAREYVRLDQAHHVYLDYTGGGLYADSQVKAHTQLLLDNVFGNPHSTNPTSIVATHLIEHARAYLLQYFNASPDDYIAIFTQNASGALKIVGESYPFNKDGHYLLTFDNHNSVNGIREFAHAKGATVTYTPTLPPDLRIDENALNKNLDRADPNAHNLFAYPAQSNFSGVQHSLEWIEVAHAKGWDVLLDAAAFIPTNRLDLSLYHPDFVTLSFYKIFGYPTGLGCLIARKSALKKLHRPWFAGGTITVASVQGNKHYLHDGAEAFEDGTLNYLGIPAIEIGLKHIAAINIETIHTRVTCLADWLLKELVSLKHNGGNPVVKIYGPADMQNRGGTITMNFFDPRGWFIDHRYIEAEANKVNISLRTGCFCNPGDGELALGISAEELTSCFIKRPDALTIDDFRRCIDAKSTGAVRVSVGLVSNFSDVYRFVEFAKTFVDRRVDEN